MYKTFPLLLFRSIVLSFARLLMMKAHACTMPRNACDQSYFHFSDCSPVVSICMYSSDLWRSVLLHKLSKKKEMDRPKLTNQPTNQLLTHCLPSRYPKLKKNTPALRSYSSFCPYCGGNEYRLQIKVCIH